MYNKGPRPGLLSWQHLVACPCASKTCFCWGQAVGDLYLPPLWGDFLPLLKFCQHMGQKRTTEVEASECTELREEESRRENEG